MKWTCLMSDILMLDILRGGKLALVVELFVFLVLVAKDWCIEAENVTLVPEDILQEVLPNASVIGMEAGIKLDSIVTGALDGFYS